MALRREALGQFLRYHFQKSLPTRAKSRPQETDIPIGSPIFVPPHRHCFVCRLRIRIVRATALRSM